MEFEQGELISIDNAISRLMFILQARSKNKDGVWLDKNDKEEYEYFRKLSEKVFGILKGD